MTTPTRRVRFASGALAIGLSLAACEENVDKAPADAERTAGPQVSASAMPAVSSGAGSRLDCAGGQMSIGITDHAAPEPGSKPDQGFRVSPTQFARAWFNRHVQTPSWASAGPFTIEQVDTRTKSGQRKIRVDYRAADGRLLGTLGVLWDEQTGWRVGGWRACAEPAGEATPAALPTDPGLVIYRGMFSPRAVHSSLDCSGANGGGAIFDRGSEPPADPQTVEEHAAKWEADQSNRANPRWNDAAPPRRWYYYPRDPAIAARAVVDWVDDEGRVVMSLGLSKYDGSPAWHVGSWTSCVGGSGVV